LLTSCLLLGFLSCFFFGGLIDDIVLAWLLGIKLVIVVGCRSLVDWQLESLGKGVQRQKDDRQGYVRNSKNAGGIRTV